jgi:hypothetical protein
MSAHEVGAARRVAGVLQYSHACNVRNTPDFPQDVAV